LHSKDGIGNLLASHFHSTSAIKLMGYDLPSDPIFTLVEVSTKIAVAFQQHTAAYINDYYRIHRRTFHQHFRSDAIEAYHPFIYQATSQFLQNLLKHIDLENSSSVMKFENLDAVVRQ
jgi:hypothetical protein